MSSWLSFQRSFDASFRRSFEASDARSQALSLKTSDARSDVTSTKMSDGRSNEVSLRISVLRYFPANSETSFQLCLERRVSRHHFPAAAGQKAGRVSMLPDGQR
jgi:hypothetical protein